VSRPTVSACIAVYNGQQHLGKAIDSVLGQTVQPDEILVLDDGSTDDSAEVARSYNAVRLIQRKNGGIGAARRALVEAATGDWIAFCDHDDWWEPNRLEEGISAASSEETTLIYCGAWLVDASGSRTESPLHSLPSAPSIDHVVPYPEDIWSSTTLLRRSAVLRVGNFNSFYRTGEDLLMWFQLGGLGNIVQIPDRLVSMLRRPDSTSSPSKQQFEFAVSLYEEEVLPNLDQWYSHVDQSKRDASRRLLEAKLGYTMSILAAYVDREGDHAEALRLYRRAAQLEP